MKTDTPLNNEMETPRPAGPTQKETQQYITWMEELLFNISHSIRQPVAQILGLTNLIEASPETPGRLTRILAFIKQSALMLDCTTKELSVSIYKKLKILRGKGTK